MKSQDKDIHPHRPCMAFDNGKRQGRMVEIKRRGVGEGRKIYYGDIHVYDSYWALWIYKLRNAIVKRKRNKQAMHGHLSAKQHQNGGKEIKHYTTYTVDSWFVWNWHSKHLIVWTMWSRSLC